MNGKVRYENETEVILKEVKKIMEDAERSQGVKIVIERGVEQVPTISYEIINKMVII